MNHAPWAGAIVELDKVDSSDAGTWNLADINSVAQRASEIVVPVGPVARCVVGVVEDEGAVVQAHSDLSVVGAEVGAIEALDVERMISELV